MLDFGSAWKTYELSRGEPPESPRQELLSASQECGALEVEGAAATQAEGPGVGIRESFQAFRLKTIRCFNISMCTYMYIYICMQLYVCIYIYIYVHIHLY